MKIWAHRGCSQMYPENTLLAFSKACEINGLTGIELDIQLTKDGKMVVIHDEKVDRTTNGKGFVKDYTLTELKQLEICSINDTVERIPTIEEVLDLVEPRLHSGMKLNIELKNSSFRYEGMEEKIISLIHKRDFRNNVIYSTFYAKSLEMLHNIDPDAELGILDNRVSDCLYKLRGGCCATALHPYWRNIDLPAEKIKKYSVRAYFSGHLYPEKSTGTVLDLNRLKNQGITDVFLNEPEKYLN